MSSKGCAKHKTLAAFAVCSRLWWQWMMKVRIQRAMWCHRCDRKDSTFFLSYLTTLRVGLIALQTCSILLLQTGALWTLFQFYDNDYNTKVLQTKLVGNHFELKFILTYNFDIGWVFFWCLRDLAAKRTLYNKCDRGFLSWSLNELTLGLHIMV